MTVRTLPERRAIKAALRAAGLSSRQVDALLRQGWRGVVGPEGDEFSELSERVDALAALLDSSKVGR